MQKTICVANVITALNKPLFLHHMNKVKHYLPGLFLLFIFLVIGMVIFNDYGISFDEFVQHNIGDVNYRYVFWGDRELDNFLDKEYGVGFELPLIALEKLLHLTDKADVYAMRHIMTHTFFLLCMFAGYVLALKLYKNQLVAIATFLMLVLSPRIYAHSFINTKDIPSLSAVVLCLFAAYNAFNKKTIGAYLLLGIVCGFAVGLRLMNMIIAAPVIGYLVLDIIYTIKTPKAALKHFISLLLFFIVGCLVMYISWPALWRDVYNDIFIFYEHLSKFRWLGDVLLNGDVIPAYMLPWYYIPLWFTITVPIYWQLLCIIGIVMALVLFIKRPIGIFDSITVRMHLMFVFCFIAPVGAVIYLKAVLYDDWRHLYFIYPAFVFLVAFAINELLKTKLKTIVLTLFALQLYLVLFFFIKFHPNQNVYFNELIPHSKDYLMNHYELDYWQHSYRQGLLWVAENSKKDKVHINAGKIVLERNVACLAPSIREHFVITDNDTLVDYYLETFRTTAYKYKQEESTHEIVVLGSPILRIKKMK